MKNIRKRLVNFDPVLLRAQQTEKIIDSIEK